MIISRELVKFYRRVEIILEQKLKNQELGEVDDYVYTYLLEISRSRALSDNTRSIICKSIVTNKSRSIKLVYLYSELIYREGKNVGQLGFSEYCATISSLLKEKGSGILMKGLETFCLVEFQEKKALDLGAVLMCLL